MPGTIFASGLGAPECPILLPDGHLLCVEMDAARSCVTWIEAGTGRKEIILRTGGHPNGLVREISNAMWIAEVSEHALIHIDMRGRELDRITRCAGEPLLWPNDLVIGPDGALYVTDSGVLVSDWIADDGQSLREGWESYKLQGRVYRIDRDSGRAEMIDDGLRFANGLAFGPDALLYVAETLGGNIYRYDATRPAPATRELFGTVFGGDVPAGFSGPDGIKFGADGRLYCAVVGGGRIAVIDSDGRLAETIPTLGPYPTNLAFSEDGSRMLYVTEIAQGVIERHAVPCDGLPLFR